MTNSSIIVLARSVSRSDISIVHLRLVIDKKKKKDIYFILKTVSNTYKGMLQ